MTGTVILMAAVAFLQQTPAPPIPTFGTTVVLSTGIRGQIYHLHHVHALPDLTKMKAKGEIYTTRLNIQPQDFSAGFPGVTRRNEWFAIEYEARFWAERDGVYRFRLLSDDGADLFIDGLKVIDNDGLHAPQAREGAIPLAKGVHQMRLPYFQGPRFHVALVLEIALPAHEFELFDTNKLKPPT